MLFCTNVYNYTYKLVFVNAVIYIKNDLQVQVVRVLFTNVFTRRTPAPDQTFPQPDSVPYPYSATILRNSR